jgi:TfoX/Sxy family transcriptional regulator of competence genes
VRAESGKEDTVAWRKPPQELVDYLDSVVPDGPAPVEFRPMFGGPCYWTGGNMFAAIHQESMIVRLSEEDRQALLREPGAALFEPMEGRPMREYVVIPPQIAEDREAVRAWLAKGLAFTASLPPKVKKPRKPHAAG